MNFSWGRVAVGGRNRVTQREHWEKTADVVKDLLSCSPCTRNVQTYAGRASVGAQSEAISYTSGSYLAGCRVQMLSASAGFKHTFPLLELWMVQCTDFINSGQRWGGHRGSQVASEQFISVLMIRGMAFHRPTFFSPVSAVLRNGNNNAESRKEGGRRARRKRLHS